MNRPDWVNEKRREAVERYDTWWAPTYAEKWGTYSNTSHLEFIRKFLSRLPRQSKILDAACGAGRYFSNLLDEGHIVMGIDQSQGMLASAKARYPNVEVEKVGLQEMTFSNVFDGVVCMDAMEHVFPEDWPLVLDNFHREISTSPLKLPTREKLRQRSSKVSNRGYPSFMEKWKPVMFTTITRQ
jgi:2-polyprenyl-3-methyl-5-hydroxy-6-metoxy-1,4-benzoquinol methylase